MTQVTKNHGHPTAKTLLTKLSYGIGHYPDYRLINSQVIGEEELKEDQYLYTKYIDELQRGLTKLDYDEWYLDELQRNALLRTFAHQEGAFANKKKRIVELLCSKKLSLLNHAENVESQIVEAYGEQRIRSFDKDQVLLAEQAIDKSEVTNIVLLGNQMLRSALYAFHSSERERNSITCAIACDVNNYSREKAIIEKFVHMPIVSGKVITEKSYVEPVGSTILYIQEYTRRDKRKRLF
jgi:hypothetical protein